MIKSSESKIEASSKLLKKLCEKGQLPDSDVFGMFINVNEAVVCCKWLEKRGFITISPTGSLGTLISNDYTCFAVENNTLINEYNERIRIKDRQKEIEDLNIKLNSLQVNNLEYEKSNQELKKQVLILDKKAKKWDIAKSYSWLIGVLLAIAALVGDLMDIQGLFIKLFCFKKAICFI
jgi:hypothetical protein